MDACLLDEDVLRLIPAAFPGLSMEEIVDYDGIMAGFWCNTDRGKELMMQVDNEGEIWALKRAKQLNSFI